MSGSGSEVDWVYESTYDGNAVAIKYQYYTIAGGWTAGTDIEGANSFFYPTITYSSLNSADAVYYYDATPTIYFKTINPATHALGSRTTFRTGETSPIYTTSEQYPNSLAWAVMWRVQLTLLTT